MFGKLAFFMLLALLCVSGMALADRRDNSILLNGAWEFAVGQGDEKAETAAGQAGLKWAPVTIAGAVHGVQQRQRGR